MKNILFSISYFIYKYINENLGLKIRGRLAKHYSEPNYWSDIRVNGEEIKP